MKRGIRGDRARSAALAGLLAAGMACGEGRAALVVANGPDVQSLDPHRATGSADGRLMRALYAGLTRLDPATLRPEPALAAGWDAAGDYRVWTFRLRPALRWSDGSPLTSADFLASWKRLLRAEAGGSYGAWLGDLDGAAAWLAAGGEGALPGLTAAGDTLTARFVRPMPFFAEMCAWHVLAPVHRSVRQAAPGDPLETAPTPGPFRLVFRRFRDRVRVERNPCAWNAAEVALPSIDFLTVESSFTALNLFLTGDADFLADVPALAIRPLEERERRRAAVAGPDGRPPRAEFDPTPFLGTYFYRLNTRRPPLDDPRVRRALALAVDRKALAATLAAGQPAARSLVPPWIPGYEPAAGPGFDPERARALLAEAGFPQGQGLRPLEVLFNTSEMHRDVAQALQDQWRRHLGVETVLANAEFKTVQAQQSAGRYDLSRSSWVADYSDPENFLEVFRSVSPDNRTGWADPEYDALLDAARHAGDPGLRFAGYRAAEDRLLREAPLIVLFFYLNTDLVSERVLDYHRNARGYTDWSRLAIVPPGNRE